ncbi:MAG: hypothetical protein R3B13_39435 [Polyangiaceae bacterium]
MRRLALLALCFSCGCASTVSRLPGPVEAPGGEAQSQCESEQWLTLAPTRYQLPARDSVNRLVTHKDGLGVYPAGDDSPLALDDVADRMGPTADFPRHRERYAARDRDRWIAAGLGVGAAAALAVGTVLLVGAFDTKTTVQPDGTRDEEQVISGGRAAAGGITLGLGFGLGVASMLVAPSATERADADAAKYVFRPKADDLGALRERASAANGRTRERCSAPASAAPAR